MARQTVEISGRCECGGVRFRASGARPTVTICHCSQCRRMSGHQWASTKVPFASLIFESDETLAWYASSDWASRGFCKTCGSSLFYRANGKDGIGIAAGSLDAPTGLRPGKHIFCASAGDYYTIPDDAPHFQE